MKTRNWFLCVVTLVLAQPVLARDDIGNYSVSEALEEGRAKGVISDIPLYFGDGKLPPVKQRLGEYTSNKKTNAFNKSDKEACHWAFLSAVKSLQQRAVKEGGNAVINVRSYYKKNDFRSPTEFQCGAGALMAGVTLVGTVAKM